jgi:CCR4-NOT transcription complex subunit 3
MCTIQCKLTCQDEDFDYDTGIYDDLNLMDEEDFTADFAHNDEASLDGASLVDSTEATSTLPKTPAKDEALSKKSTPATKTKKKDSLSVTTGDDHGSAVDDAHAPSSPVLSKKATSRKSTMDSTKVETPTKGGIPPVPPVPAVAATPVKAALPPIRYAAAAAAAVANSSASAPTPSAQAVPMQESPVKAKTELPATSPVKEATQVNVSVNNHSQAYRSRRGN